MKIMSKSLSKELKIGTTCVAHEYEMGDKDINGAVITITGRSPESGRVVNTVCKEMAFVMEGAGKVVIEDRTFELQTGDMVIIDPGEKYFWEGTMILFVPCTPAWTPEQSKEIL